MTDPLHVLLGRARAEALVTGNGAEEIAPGVTRAEAEMAAWHTCTVQGGFSTPELEAERLYRDRARAALAHNPTTPSGEPT